MNTFSHMIVDLTVWMRQKTFQATQSDVQGQLRENMQVFDFFFNLLRAPSSSNKLSAMPSMRKREHGSLM